jgi:beta-galactosidase GanA
MYQKGNFILLLLMTAGSMAFARCIYSGVQVKKETGAAQLLTQGKPFLILGGELGNSTTSSINYLKPFFPKLKEMNLNTVLSPLYWELMEPEENKFDFSLEDEMLAESGRQNMKLIFLWFGTWKNSMSCYAPAWVKINSKLFPRTYDTAGRSQGIFSVFGKETMDADKKAFAALIMHIRETDSAGTVIMVQVENEIGMLPTSREFSETANDLINARVPAELMNYMQKNKNSPVPELKAKWEKQGFKNNDTWTNTFGADNYTEEISQAWYFAKYTNEVIAAGKKEYDLPLFVNAALPRPGKLPGQHPSAGPMPHLMDIRQEAAPAIYMLSPDFYHPGTKYWCDLDAKKTNPLFVPEMRLDESCAAKVFFTIGYYKAPGFSTFSIENAEGAAKTALGKSYSIISQTVPLITGNKWLNCDGLPVDKKDGVQQIQTGNYTLKVSHG